MSSQELVSISQVKAFLRCRLAWFWSTKPPRGLGLEPLVAKPALSLGRLVHAALQEYYDKGIPPDLAYIPLAEQEEKLLGETQDVWPEEAEAIRDQFLLGLTMLQGYDEWAKQHDNFRVLATETRGVVELTPDIGLSCRLDGVVEDENGLWVLEFKTTSSTQTSWTASDLQATAYVYAAQKLFGQSVMGIRFRFLRKKIPYTYDKLLLKKGGVTQRKDLTKLTTYNAFLQTIAVAVLRELQPQLSPDACAEALREVKDGNKPSWYADWSSQFSLAKRVYRDQLEDLRDANTFYWDDVQYRTPVQLANYLKYVIIPAAKIMTSKHPWVGPTGLGTAYASCPNCAFREPCRQVMAGADYQDTLRTQYKPREDDEGEGY